MLSVEDFDRLISDPRLGRVKRFFHPAQCIIEDYRCRQENKWKPYRAICYETSSEDRSRVRQSRIHQKTKQNRGVAILVFTAWQKIVENAFNVWISQDSEDMEYGNNAALYASAAINTTKVSIVCLKP